MSTIAVISHARQAELPTTYLLGLMRQVWEADGIRVEEVYGTRRPPPADLAFVHVALSQVPPSYLKLARRYRAHVNAGIADIRKSTFSRNLVRPGDGYDGPVIVKSALNYFGRAERVLLAARLRLPLLRRLLARRAGLGFPFRLESKADYRLYNSVRQVPPGFFRDSTLVVERFLPERHGDLYCLREWYFLGDRSFSNVELSPEAVFTHGTSTPDLAMPPPLEVVQLRVAMKCDYGKIDYAMHDGRAVIFDLNKTVGVTDAASPGTREMAATLAPGIYTYLRRHSP